MAVRLREPEFRRLLSGGDRRSIADSGRVRALVERNPRRVKEIVELTTDDNWLINQRALDLMEKLAHDHPQWIEPHKKIFLGRLAESDKWEIRLQVVRALPLFSWSAGEMRRVEQILLASVEFPQTFVRAWSLDSLATFSERRRKLQPIVKRYLDEFENSPSKALQARARNIRLRMAG